MLIENSGDLLNVVIAGSVLLFTVFVCWMLYYFIVMLRNMAKMTASIRDKLETVDKILHLVKDKLEKGSNHMAMISDSAIKLVGFLIDKQSQKKSSSKRKRSKSR